VIRQADVANLLFLGQRLKLRLGQPRTNLTLQRFAARGGIDYAQHAHGVERWHAAVITNASVSITKPGFTPVPTTAQLRLMHRSSSLPRVRGVGSREK